MSVVVALVIGTVVRVGSWPRSWASSPGLLARVGSLNIDYIGFTMVGLFVLTWLIAVDTWRFGRIEEERWTRRTADSAEGER
ncbi:high-affinity nickel-transport protein [Pseudonocardia kunmingensis]|uniref:Nickel/cobalt efflux system n=2 Tax=Pseudonocardia kunmingensis TaxID=630975 RepID=A0A543DKN6_9PSEU|nr:high-affinity nickel-transport protein [Pseudonocardia kunmingensis]